MTELSSLQNIGEAMTATLELDEMMNTITSHAKEVVAAENIALVLIDSHTKKAGVKVSVGPNADLIGEREIERKDGLISHVLDTHKPILVCLYEQNLSPKSLVDRLKAVGGLVAVPLIAKGEALGVLTVSEKSSSASFDHQDLRVLSTFGERGGVGDKKRLFVSKLDKAIFGGGQIACLGQ